MTQPSPARPAPSAPSAPPAHEETFGVLLLATTNSHKAAELSQVLQLPGVRCTDLVSALGADFEPSPETGTTFAENALQKARFYAAASGLPTLADDSGICVDALGGAPGIASARFEGEHTPAAVKNARLLELLHDVPEVARTARFRCAIALVTPEGLEVCVEGHHEGRIIASPTGEAGFGYDPIFLSTSENLTFAQLPSERKNQVSHRARALAALLETLHERPALLERMCKTQGV